MSFTTSTGHFDQLILGVPFSLHGFPAPFRRRFPALPCGVIAGYPMQTVMRFSRCGAGFGNKKSPHNNLNLTIPSGMALVRVRYVAIRKLKTCSGSFGSRAGTLSKYVILNCWNRLPQKSSHVNVNLSGQGPSILLRKTVLSLKSPTGAFIAPLRCANASLPRGRRNRLISQPKKNRKFPPVGNSLLYISLLSVALIASFTSSAILNDLFAICNSRLLPTNQIVNYAGRVRPIQGRTLFLFCI